MLSGYFAAVVTPFKNGEIDKVSFEKYINYIIGSGISGIIVCGSTGESLSLRFEEKVELIKHASKINNKKIKIFAGVIESCTKKCVNFIEKTEEYVDGFLSICPFYIKPLQEHIFQHFKTLSSSTKKDIILYNNPSRVAIDMSFDVVKKLSEIENIIAIKECASDISRFALWRKYIKKEFSLLSGNDDTACGALAMGASGIISVSANVIPAFCVQMCKALENNDFERFCEIRNSIVEFHSLMFMEPSPAPVKYALSQMGLISNELREPLQSISDSLKLKIDDFLKNNGILNERI